MMTSKKSMPEKRFWQDIMVKKAYLNGKSKKKYVRNK